jgi:uncharacterized membrane protein YphA (DoxX/SURF4 family)
MADMTDITKDIKLWLVILVLALGAIGVLIGKMTWAEAGGVVGTVVAAYIAADAVKMAIVQLAKR